MSLVNDLRERLRWFRRSSILRLTALLLAIVAVGMTGAISAALFLGERTLESRADATLTGLAATLTVDDIPTDTSSVTIRPVDRLRDIPRAFVRGAAQGQNTVHLDDDWRGSDTWRILITPDPRGNLAMIAVPFEDSIEALELLGGILWSTMFVVLGVTLTLGLGAGLLAQRRLQRIAGTLDQLAAGDLKARTGLSGTRDDLGALARQLDVTAGELERLITQTRHLSASIAHDLRTPLARLRARLETLPDSEERGAALEEAGRLSAIFDTIMRVARIEATQGQAGFETVDLGQLGAEIAEIFGPVVEDAEKELRVEVSNPASLNADRQMLMQALANLIQNALVHGGQNITLFVDGAQIGVADDGPGVDPADYGEIIKPMVRLDAARSRDGSGLGLALVRAVVDRHSGRLELSPNSPRGLKVSLNLTEL
jgi:signal transduction histidine kinase